MYTIPQHDPRGNDGVFLIACLLEYKGISGRTGQKFSIKTLFAGFFVLFFKCKMAFHTHKKSVVKTKTKQLGFCPKKQPPNQNIVVLI